MTILQFQWLIIVRVILVFMVYVRTVPIISFVPVTLDGPENNAIVVSVSGHILFSLKTVTIVQLRLHFCHSSRKSYI